MRLARICVCPIGNVLPHWETLTQIGVMKLNNDRDIYHVFEGPNLNIGP